MCCNNNYYGYNDNHCGCCGVQGGNSGNNGGWGKSYNFVVSARIAPYNPCYINPYTGCAVPYGSTGGSCNSYGSGCGCNHKNCCHCCCRD